MSIRGIVGRMAGVFARERIDAELGAEIEEHLRIAEDEYRARGLSVEDARDAARREFGSAALAREASREEWSWPWLESYLSDVRFGLRVLRKQWASTTVAVIALGVGVGATTGVVSTLDAVRLPVRVGPDFIEVEGKAPIKRVRHDLVASVQDENVFHVLL